MSDLFQLASDLDIIDILFKQDKSTGLDAIIAIHNTNLGTALGGCRFVEYPTTQDVIQDAMNLA